MSGGNGRAAESRARKGKRGSVVLEIDVLPLEAACLSPPESSVNQETDIGLSF